MAGNVSSQFAQLLGHADVVLQVVLGPGGVEDVAGVADRRLADGAALDHRLHRRPHVGHPVERIEHAEHVDARAGGLFDELVHDIVGIVRVAHRVGRPQQHLEENVGDALAHLGQPLPGAFVEETHGHVERRAAPHFDREKIGAQPRVGVGDLEQVISAEARGQQRLMGVAERRVGDQQLLLRPQPLRELLRAHLLELLPHAVGYG